MNLLSIANIFSGGTATLYKYLAIGGIVLSGLVGSYFYGHHLGVQSQLVAQEKSVIKNQQTVLTITKYQTVIDTKAVGDLQKQLDSEKAKTLVLKNKISTLSNQQLQVLKPAVNGNPPECVLSKAWVDDYNASVKRAIP
jgi:hypothetical protein